MSGTYIHTRCNDISIDGVCTVSNVNYQTPMYYYLCEEIEKLYLNKT